MTNLTATAPTYREYADLQTRAEDSVRADHGFVDPSKMAELGRIHRGHDWTLAVLGHNETPTLVEIHMLLIANRDGLTPPLPDHIRQAREAHAAEEAERRRRGQDRADRALTEWAELAASMPVPVCIAYNYSGPNHYESYHQGAVHILVGEDLRVGRLIRPGGYLTHSALCATPSRLAHLDMPHTDLPEDRWPTCKACLRTASRVTRKDFPVLAGGSR